MRFPLPSRVDVLTAAVLFALSFATCFGAMKSFRAVGLQPQFYQGNFDPAVNMACGHGFVTTLGESPVPLTDFLQLRRNDFDCAWLAEALPRGEVTWNATWYYLYGTCAAVWKVFGISWTVLDGLVALFGGIVSVALYGLFRLVTARWAATAATFVLLVSPANLTHLLSLRDYSKAPFVLTAVLILAVLVVKPLERGGVIVLAAAYGALVGFGYGFRSDLAVMVPFGLFVVLALLPGGWRHNVARNVGAFAVLLVTFGGMSWPALSGLGRHGGCQFHYALLGLTTPLTNELGVAPSLYRFGSHFLDTFIDLKVGDYAHRVLDMPVPLLCSAEYDVASAGLFRQIVDTFPADLILHTYASVSLILRAGLAIPAMMQPAPPFPSFEIVTSSYQFLNYMTQSAAPLGLPLTLAAIGLAWSKSARLGIALTAFVLFLAGYPAIEFEQRHWFHLRFIPWWAGLCLITNLVIHGPNLGARTGLLRAVVGTVGLVGALSVALVSVRAYQTRSVTALIEQYVSAHAEVVPFLRVGSQLHVEWAPRDYAAEPEHRASDLLVVTLEGAECAGDGPLTLRAQYDADAPSHDLSEDIVLIRPAPGEGQTQVFVPVFWQGFADQTYLRFARFEMSGAPSTCITQVGRVTEGSALPLWIETQVPPDWRSHRLYQSFRLPRLLAAVVARLP